MASGTPPLSLVPRHGDDDVLVPHLTHRSELSDSSSRHFDRINVVADVDGQPQLATLVVTAVTSADSPPAARLAAAGLLALSDPLRHDQARALVTPIGRRLLEQVKIYRSLYIRTGRI